MFVPFQRLGDTDNTTGVGLGLALSRGLTEAMGGTLDRRGHPRRRADHDACRCPAGHRARLRDPSRGPARARTPAAGQPVTRVLVVDDEPQILRALRINLRVRDYEVDTAATGGRGAGGGRPRTRRTW